MWTVYEQQYSISRCGQDATERAYRPLTKKDSVDPRTDSRLEFADLRNVGRAC